MLGADDLPESAEELRQLVLKQRTALAARYGIIERLKAQLTWLHREQFGRSSEKIEREIAQLELQLEDLEESSSARRAAGEPQRSGARAGRRPLPDHLPREEIVHEAVCTCPDCGGPMRRLGEDASEMLEYVPASFRVVRHVRPKLVCSRCDRIVQSEAPSRPIARGLAGPGLLAHVLVAKYADHLPLYRQSEIYAREGVALERSTLADWVGSTSALLQPLVAALARETLQAAKLHADDTPVPVLAPGHGRTRTGRLWVYVRDDRAAGDSAPPSVLFHYSADRKGGAPARPSAGVPGLPAGRWLCRLQPTLRQRDRRGRLLGPCSAQVPLTCTSTRAPSLRRRRSNASALSMTSRRASAGTARPSARLYVRRAPVPCSRNCDDGWI